MGKKKVKIILKSCVTEKGRTKRQHRGTDHGSTGTISTTPGKIQAAGYAKKPLRQAQNISE